MSSSSRISPRPPSKRELRWATSQSGMCSAFSRESGHRTASTLRCSRDFAMETGSCQAIEKPDHSEDEVIAQVGFVRLGIIGAPKTAHLPKTRHQCFLHYR